MQKIEIAILLLLPLIFVYGEFLYISEARKQSAGLRGNKETDKIYFETKLEKKYPSTTVIDVFRIVITVIFLLCVALVVTAAMCKYAMEAVTELYKLTDSIPGIMFTGLLGLIACLGIFAKWQKVEYVAFELNDIIEKSSTVRNLKCIAGGSIAGFVFQVLGSDFNYFEIIIFSQCALLIDYAIFLVLFFCITYQFIDICLGHNMEKRMLKLLYKNFWYESNKEISVDKQNTSYMMQITYLINEYINLSHNKRIKSIKTVKYNTNLIRGERNNRLKTRSLFISFIFMSTIVFIIFIYLLSYSFKYTGVFAVFYVMFGIQFWIVGLLYEPLSMMLVRVVYGKCGYEIAYGEKGQKYTYVNDGNNSGIFFKYINIIRSIMAYADMLGKENEGIKKYFEEECHKFYSSEKDIELINILLKWIFTDKEDKQLKSVSEADGGVARYAREFIKDCFYTHPDLEMEIAQEKSMWTKKKMVKKIKNTRNTNNILIFIAIILVVVVALIVASLYIKDECWKDLFMSLIGAMIGGIFTTIGVIISLRVEQERQANILRIERMPLLDFKTYSTTLETLENNQIFSIMEDGVCTSAFPAETDKVYTGFVISLANNNPAFNVHIYNAIIDDGFTRKNYDVNNPMEVRLVGSEQLKIMIYYMAYNEAVKKDCNQNISGVIQLKYEDVFGNQYVQEIPVIFTENSMEQKMEIRTIGQAKYIGKK